jgi:hypothetical protein
MTVSLYVANVVGWTEGHSIIWIEDADSSAGLRDEEGVVESDSTGSRVLLLTDSHVEMRPGVDTHFVRAKGGERVY